MIYEKKQEIDMLYGENIFVFDVKKSIDKFSMTHAFPIEYEGCQYPVFFKIKNGSSKKLLKYEIFDDKNKPNKNIKFTFSSLKKNEKIRLHFEYFLLVKNTDYGYLPNHVDMPKKLNFPNHIKKWLQPSKSIQSENSFIKIKSFLIKPFTKNLLDFTYNLSYKICFHRPILSKINLILGNMLLNKKYWPYLNDSLSCYFFGGACTARTNLEVATLRASNIPARVLIGTSLYYQGKKWCDAQHYFFEYYTSKYGWIRGMSGRVPYEPKNCIVLRINYPGDENIAGNGLGFYGGCIPWFWIDDDDIILDFPKEGSYYKRKRGWGRPINRGFIYKEIFTSKVIAEKVFDVTQNVWKKFITFYGRDLKKENKKYLSNAYYLQEKAIQNFHKGDINQYINNMQNAYQEFKKIK